LSAVGKEEIKKIKKDLRAKCLNASNFEKENKCILGVPYDVRDEAMNDLLKAYKRNFVKGDQFQIKYRKKKDERESIIILNKHWGRKSGVYSFLSRMKSAEPLIDKLQYDSRLIRTRLGQYYLCVSKPLEIRFENQGLKFTKKQESQGADVIALNPGVRCFQTGCDANGLIMECGKYDIGRIYRLCHVVDDLQSRWSRKEVRHRKRYRLQKVARRTRLKIRNLVDDCHKKLVKWLCEHYRVVLLPEFVTSQMLRRGQKRIDSKTARAMATWSHFRFKQRLLNKTREYPWCKVIKCNEAYTSKTCGCSGFIHNHLGGSKVFNCMRCHFYIRPLGLFMINCENSNL
jgi:putative transposase